MTGRYKAYPTYRNSGVKHLRDVPKNWNIKPLKFCSTHNDEVLPESTPSDFTIEYIDISSVTAEHGITSTQEMLFENAPSRARRIVRHGDVIISTVRTYLEAISPISNPARNTIVSTGFTVIRPQDGLSPEFAAYACRSRGFIDEIVARSTGVSYPAINASELVTIQVALPNSQEQAQIAAFLDHESAKIDRLIHKQVYLIELLQEKRQAVISRAVTKGLTPNAPMKDSGIEWLGEIPAHWDVKCIKHLTLSMEQGWSPQCEGRPAQDHEWGVLKVGCVNGGQFREGENKRLPEDLIPKPQYALREGDLLISRANVRELVGSAAVVERDHPNLMLCDKLYRVRFNSRIAPQYISYLLGINAAREQIELAATGASHSMQNIGQSTIKELACPIPPREEQEEIVNAVEKQLTALGKTVSKAADSIKFLQERRAALISAAVTGKIDVRDRQAASEPAAACPAVNLGAIVAAEILSRCQEAQRTKLQKLLYFADNHAGIDTGNVYQRQAAGPHDPAALESIECELEHQKWFKKHAHPNGQGYSYLKMAKAGQHQTLLDGLSNDQLARLRQVIELFRNESRKKCEIAATLHAAWNDLLLQGRPATKTDVVNEVWTNWHIKKRDTPRYRWISEFDWLNRHLPPTGTGKATRLTCAPEDDRSGLLGLAATENNT